MSESTPSTGEGEEPRFEGVSKLFQRGWARRHAMSPKHDEMIRGFFQRSQTIGSVKRSAEKKKKAVTTTQRSKRKTQNERGTEDQNRQRMSQ